MTKIKTPRKWEKECNIKLEWVTYLEEKQKMFNVKFAKRDSIMSCKNLRDSWIKG